MAGREPDTTEPTPRALGLPRWVAYAVAAGLCWGAWGVVSKAMDDAKLTTYQIHLLFTVGLVLPCGLAAASKRVRVGSRRRAGFAWGVAAGFLGGLGNLAFYAALGQGGKASVVVPLTSLYPLVTLFVAWLALNERLNRVQGVGILVSVVAGVLLCGEAHNFGDLEAVLAGLSGSRWLLSAAVALAFWGLLSVAQKVSTNCVSSELSFVGFCVAFGPMAAALLLVEPVSLDIPPVPLALGVAAGAVNGLGVLASFAAYRSEGKASLVTPLAGVVQSVSTVALAVAALGERIRPVEVVGCAVAVLASALLSVESTPALQPVECPPP